MYIIVRMHVRIRTSLPQINPHIISGAQADRPVVQTEDKVRSSTSDYIVYVAFLFDDI